MSRSSGPPGRAGGCGNDRIVDPEGNETTQAQLRAYWLIMQYAADLARRDPRSYEHFQALLRQA